MNQKDTNTKTSRFDFDNIIKHRCGASMRHVNALSRNSVLMVTQDGVTLKIIQAQETDEHRKAIKEIFKVKPYDECLI